MNKYYSIFSLLVFIIVFMFAEEVFAVDQMKTLETFVGDSDTPISSQINRDFSIYIGDNLSGVTNPIKSVYFVVSGVYTSGAGSLELKIDSDAATSMVFNLPAVSSSPTPFEIFYKDPSNKINPASAGTYAYQLNIIPSSVTIYGFGAKVVITYRYAPTSCDDGQPSNEKVKTTEHFVGDSNSAIDSQINRDFSIYIGDNLSGVTDPVKSVYFVVSGVYTGGAGTLELKIDSDAATSMVFNLPAVSSSPTPFEIFYKDPSNKINPASAGTYVYQLNIIPGSVTIYGFGAKVVETHRYKPPACGGMPILGELTSTVFETTGSSDGPAYNSISWKGQLGGGDQNEGKVRFQLATSDCPNAATNPPTCSPSGTWAFIGGSNCSTGDWYDATNVDKTVETKCPDHNNKRYYRYKVQICSNDCVSAGPNTPTVTDVNVSWSP